MADLKGLKRICMSCGARFYDLNKKPIICPSCNTEFTGEIKVKTRRGRLPSEAVEAQVEEEVPVLAVEEEETEVVEEGETETVSLEEIEEDSDDVDEDAITLDEDDIEIDDEDLDDLDDDDIDEDIAEEEEEK